VSSSTTEAMQMSLLRLISSLVPVKGVSQMPTTASPLTSCSRPCTMCVPITSGTKNSDAVVPCSPSMSDRMRGCDAMGKVM